VGGGGIGGGVRTFKVLGQTSICQKKTSDKKGGWSNRGKTGRDRKGRKKRNLEKKKKKKKLHFLRRAREQE